MGVRLFPDWEIGSKLEKNKGLSVKDPLSVQFGSSSLIILKTDKKKPPRFVNHREKFFF